jgi:hypothetical protein|tara:strand:+ start:1857 stop:2030 length:174 start_codon:yes stop_codon:yes gene_type:complete
MTTLEKHSKAYYSASSNAEALREFIEENHPSLRGIAEEVCRGIDLMDKYTNVVSQPS